MTDKSETTIKEVDKIAPLEEKKIKINVIVSDGQKMPEKLKEYFQYKESYNIVTQGKTWASSNYDKESLNALIKVINGDENPLNDFLAAKGLDNTKKAMEVLLFNAKFYRGTDPTPEKFKEDLKTAIETTKNQQFNEEYKKQNTKFEKEMVSQQKIAEKKIAQQTIDELLEKAKDVTNDFIKTNFTSVSTGMIEDVDTNSSAYDIDSIKLINLIARNEADSETVKNFLINKKIANPNYNLDKFIYDASYYTDKETLKTVADAVIGGYTEYSSETNGKYTVKENYKNTLMANAEKAEKEKAQEKEIDEIIGINEVTNDFIEKNFTSIHKTMKQDVGIDSKYYDKDCVRMIEFLANDTKLTPSELAETVTNFITKKKQQNPKYDENTLMHNVSYYTDKETLKKVAEAVIGGYQGINANDKKKKKYENTLMANAEKAGKEQEKEKAQQTIDELLKDSTLNILTKKNFETNYVGKIVSKKDAGTTTSSYDEDSVKLINLIARNEATSKTVKDFLINKKIANPKYDENTLMYNAQSYINKETLKKVADAVIGGYTEYSKNNTEYTVKEKYKTTLMANVKKAEKEITLAEAEKRLTTQEEKILPEAQKIREKLNLAENCPAIIALEMENIRQFNNTNFDNQDEAQKYYEYRARQILILNGNKDPKEEDVRKQVNEMNKTAYKNDMEVPTLPTTEEYLQEKAAREVISKDKLKEGAISAQVNKERTEFNKQIVKFKEKAVRNDFEGVWDSSENAGIGSGYYNTKDMNIVYSASNELYSQAGFDKAMEKRGTEFIDNVLYTASFYNHKDKDKEPKKLYEQLESLCINKESSLNKGKEDTSNESLKYKFNNSKQKTKFIESINKAQATYLKKEIIKMKENANKIAVEIKKELGLKANYHPIPALELKNKTLFNNTNFSIEAEKTKYFEDRARLISQIEGKTTDEAALKEQAKKDQEAYDQNTNKEAPILPTTAAYLKAKAERALVQENKETICSEEDMQKQIDVERKTFDNTMKTKQNKNAKSNFSGSHDTEALQIANAMLNGTYTQTEFNNMLAGKGLEKGIEFLKTVEYTAQFYNKENTDITKCQQNFTRYLTNANNDETFKGKLDEIIKNTLEFKKLPKNTQQTISGIEDDFIDKFNADATVNKGRTIHKSENGQLPKITVNAEDQKNLDEILLITKNPTALGLVGTEFGVQLAFTPEELQKWEKEDPSKLDEKIEQRVTDIALLKVIKPGLTTKEFNEYIQDPEKFIATIMPKDGLNQEQTQQFKTSIQQLNSTFSDKKFDADKILATAKERVAKAPQVQEASQQQEQVTVQGPNVNEVVPPQNGSAIDPAAPTIQVVAPTNKDLKQGPNVDEVDPPKKDATEPVVSEIQNTAQKVNKDIPDNIEDFRRQQMDNEDINGQIPQVQEPTINQDVHAEIQSIVPTNVKPAQVLDVEKVDPSQNNQQGDQVPETQGGNPENEKPKQQNPDDPEKQTEASENGERVQAQKDKEVLQQTDLAASQTQIKASTNEELKQPNPAASQTQIKASTNEEPKQPDQATPTIQGVVKKDEKPTQLSELTKLEDLTNFFNMLLEYKEGNDKLQTTLNILIEQNKKQQEQLDNLTKQNELQKEEISLLKSLQGVQAINSGQTNDRGNFSTQSNSFVNTHPSIHDSSNIDRPTSVGGGRGGV